MHRPLHIAVVQGDINVIDRLLTIMRAVGAPVDHFNQRRQVNSITDVITVFDGNVLVPGQPAERRTVFYRWRRQDLRTGS